MTSSIIISFSDPDARQAQGHGRGGCHARWPVSLALTNSTFGPTLFFLLATAFELQQLHLLGKGMISTIGVVLCPWRQL